MRIDVVHYADDELLSVLRYIAKGVRNMSEASKEMLTLVKTVGPAIDQLEAKLTAAIKKLGTDSPETAADIQDAMTELRSTLSDAADGVDEADVPPPVEPPVVP